MATASHPLSLLLRKFETHVAFDDEDRKAVLSLPCSLRTLEPNAYTVREGEKSGDCAVLLSGFAYRHKVTYSGTRQIIAVHIPGEPLDFQHLFLDEADHNVQMLTQGTVATVPREALQTLIRSRPAVAHAIFVTILVEASIFREWIVNVGRRDARSRLAHLLCEFAIRLDAQGLAKDYGYNLPMTQEQLGDATGLTPVHINRTIKLLEAEGLVTRSGRDVSFPDWKRLKGVGEFNSRYLHLQQQASA